MVCGRMTNYIIRYIIKFLPLTKLPYALKIWFIKRNEFFDRTAIAQAACSFLFLSSKYHKGIVSHLLNGKNQNQEIPHQ